MQTDRNFLVRMITAVLLSMPVVVFGQTQESVDLKPLRSFQVSVLPGVGTDGTESVHHRYRLSLNFLGGVTGGVEGLEVSGFANLNRGMIQGAQVAGFCNLVWGDTEGFHAAGYMSIIHGSTRGFMAAGFLNLVSGNMDGFQGAGFANIVAGSSDGFQGAGFANLVDGNMDGFQGAGFANVVGGDATGFQGAGFANIAGGSVQGTSIAGFANVARDVRGMQLAGFINIARRVNGLQVGFINIADTVNGLPIGFLSLVNKGGYRQIELSGSDALHTSASLRIGVARFYNIFSFGMRPFEDVQVGGFGYGVGTLVTLSHQTALEIEGHTTWLHETNQWLSNEGERLSEMRINFTAGRSCRFNLFVGPVLYHHRYYAKPGAEHTPANLAPYTLAERQNGNYFSKWWIGARGGFRISLH